MDRIHHPSAVAMPPPVDSYATGGYPTEGNPAAGLEATVFTAYTGHALIEEVRNVILAAGLTPDKADLAQLNAALQIMFGSGNGVVFEGAGTFNWTVPAGIRRVCVRLWGGGAGGGGGGASGAGGGGSSGAFAIGHFTVTPGQIIPVTVGAGGSAGGVNVNGGGGGTSSFGALLSATGGGGGVGVNGGFGAAGAGGVATGGWHQKAGLSGGGGIQFGTSFVGGPGGPAAYAAAASLLSTSFGAVGFSPGGGGGGGANGNAGGVGAPGMVEVRW